MQPQLIVIGGPNGAGKTTCAMTLLPEVLQIKHFVNADLIAKGLSPFDTALADIYAAKVMVGRMNELKNEGESFAVETTLASRSVAALIENCRTVGYETNLIYIALDSAETALKRVALRVAKGGHYIPEDTVKRRYNRSVKNLFTIYMPIVDRWTIGDNSRDGSFVRVVAQKEKGAERQIVIDDFFIRLKEMSQDDNQA